MINKFQQGGQMDQQQQALVQFIQGIAQVAQVDPQQVMQLAQQEPERLETAVQVFQQTQDIQQAAQAFFQKEAQSAKKGAKLNYLKKLTGKCPEGQQLVYFKSGGQICSKCMAKKQKGDVIEEDKCGSKMKKKKGCDGLKVRKGQSGLNFDFWKAALRKFSNPYRTRNKQINGRPILDTTEKNGVSRTIVGNGVNNDTIYTRMTDRYPETFWDNRTNEEIYNNVKSKVRKYNPSNLLQGYMDSKLQLKDGGSLNGVPFKQPGGDFNQFPIYEPNKNYWRDTSNVKSSLESLKIKSIKQSSLQDWMKMFKRQQSLNKGFDISPITLFQPGGSFKKKSKKSSEFGGNGYNGGHPEYYNATRDDWEDDEGRKHSWLLNIPYGAETGDILRTINGNDTIYTFDGPIGWIYDKYNTQRPDNFSTYNINKNHPRYNEMRARFNYWNTQPNWRKNPWEEKGGVR